MISFTTETDGRLPSGQTLEEAITQTEQATGGSPAYYMINCAHPTHFAEVVRSDAPWLERVKGIRANASSLSHAELDEATELDRGDIVQWASLYAPTGGRWLLRHRPRARGRHHGGAVPLLIRPRAKAKRRPGWTVSGRGSDPHGLVSPPERCGDWARLGRVGPGGPVGQRPLAARSAKRLKLSWASTAATARSTPARDTSTGCIRSPDPAVDTAARNSSVTPAR